MPDDHSPLEPPLPISNSTVKRWHADDSTEFPCESRSSSGTLKCRRPAKLAGRLSLQREGRFVIETLQCLKKYGQRLDVEIAKEMGVPLTTVRRRLASLEATREIITCSLTRFENGKR